jgi:hypothetical protein
MPDRGFVLFSHHHRHHQTCLGAGYDKEACGKYFLPQLLLYFLRFLDIYDNSLKGALMDNYLEELKRMQMVRTSTQPATITTTITTTSSSSFCVVTSSLVTLTTRATERAPDGCRSRE